MDTMSGHCDKIFSWKKAISYICPNCGSAYDYYNEDDILPCEVCGTALKAEDSSEQPD